MNRQRTCNAAVRAAMLVAEEWDIHMDMDEEAIIESLGTYAPDCEVYSRDEIRHAIAIHNSIQSRRKTSSMIGFCAITVGVCSITVGMTDRTYGGPEEGGWYYDAFTPIRVFMVPVRYRSRALELLGKWRDHNNKGRRPLHSVLSDGRWTIYEGIEPATPRPHYE